MTFTSSDQDNFARQRWYFRGRIEIANASVGLVCHIDGLNSIKWFVNVMRSRLGGTCGVQLKSAEHTFSKTSGPSSAFIPLSRTKFPIYYWHRRALASPRVMPTAVFFAVSGQ
jgi:hypothetical protein